MKKHESLITIVLIYFICLANALGWINKTESFLAIIVITLHNIFLILSRIYSELNKKNRND